MRGRRGTTKTSLTKTIKEYKTVKKLAGGQK
jgi:hypothetical protein